MERNQAASNPELLEQLLKSVDKPEELLGLDGLLHRLEGALMERMLEAELSAHLGYEPSVESADHLAAKRTLELELSHTTARYSLFCTALPPDDGHCRDPPSRTERGAH